MRVAMVTESFLPTVNGVTNSVLRVLEHLGRTGHQAVVLAPGEGPATYAGAEVVRMPAVGLPGYPSFRIGLPSTRTEAVLRSFRPDVVHLASPIVVGAHAAAVSTRLGVPSVAVYQTDVPGFAAAYGVPSAAPALWRWVRGVHRLAGRTLAPSRPALADLAAHGVPRLAYWPRGVDTQRFHPRHRSELLRRHLAPGGEVLVGYVGRLAQEKRVSDLAALAGIPGVRLVVIGDGPQRDSLRRLLPGAAFLGLLEGAELSRAFASLDVFVHPGRDETFCQSAQEALACGVPVVAPAAGGLLDLVESGWQGRLAPAGDLAALRGAVMSYVDDPAGRGLAGRRGRASVMDRTWERVCEDLVGHYRAVQDPGRTAVSVAEVA